MSANKYLTIQTLRRCAGITLVEFMVSLTLSLFIVLTATSLLLASQSAYTANDDAAMIQENGRHVLEIIARAIRQAGYEDWDGDGAAKLAQTTDSASVTGLDARSLKSTNAAMDVPLVKSVNGSDVLGIRFYGAGAGDHGDGTMLNCAGFGVASASKSGSPSEPSWSIFFVAEDATGEPELRCKYQGKSGWSAVAIARGVESFQVLFGLDTDGDGIPNQFLTAREVEQLDGRLILEGSDIASRIQDKNRKTHWKKVVAVKVALLVRGAHPARADGTATVYDLFGKDYSDAYANVDAGTRIEELNLPAKSRNRIRKIFGTTIMLRNLSSGGAA
jgi:type IV pilus assembly protein PilW